VLDVIRHLVPTPGHAGDTTDGGIREGVECGGGEIEVGDFTPCATVSQSDGDALALVISGDLPPTNGVLVRVDTIVIGGSIEQQVRHGGDVLAVVIGNTTSAEASGVECTLAGLSANHE